MGERKLQREAQRRQRELLRLEKEKAKLSAVEQARLEVQTYDNKLELLLSVHREACEDWDWLSLASALPQPSPRNYFHCKLRAEQLALVTEPSPQEASKLAVERARALDDQHFDEVKVIHASETTAMEKMRALALRVLSGEHLAFIEAFAEFNPVAESIGQMDIPHLCGRIRSLREEMRAQTPKICPAVQEPESKPREQLKVTGNN